MSDDNRFSAVFGSSGGSGGGGGGADEKVKVSGADPTAGYLETKMVDDGGYTTLIINDTLTDPTNFTRVARAVISRYDNVGGTENYSSGSVNTLGGFGAVTTHGSQNTAVGVNVFNSGTGLTQSVGVGNSVASGLVLAKQITAIGNQALGSLSTAGDEQVAIGSNTLTSNLGNSGVGALTGDFNVAVGTDSLTLLDGGTRNTTLGHNAGGVITTGSRNLILGFEAGLSPLTNITTGNDNILIGYQADTDGDENIVIGNDSATQLGSAVANQSLILGNTCFANASLQIVIGNTSSITNGGQDVLIGVNSSINGSAFPTFPTLSTHVGSAGTFVGFYNQSLGYSHNVNGEDNVALGNFNSITGNDNISLGNGLSMTTTQTYGIGVDSSAYVDYSMQVSWNNGVSQFDDIRLVSKASPTAGQKSFINVKSDLSIDAVGGVVIQSGLLQSSKQFVLNEQQNPLSGVAFTPDLFEGNILSFDVTANTTINTPTNIQKGIYYFRLTQDAVGGHVITWDAGYSWAGGTAPTLTATALKSDIYMVVSCFDIASGGTKLFSSIIGQNY